jgi:hypothetical protein
MSSLRPDSDPRISYGASSARNTGTTVEAPPTARPRSTRPTTMTSNVGANTQISVPTKNVTASRMIVLRRPQPSAMRPPSMAPIAAPKSSELVTTPSVKFVRPSSAFIGFRAPLMTPVSYPKSNPPNVATRASTPSRRRCGPVPNGGSATVGAVGLMSTIR